MDCSLCCESFTEDGPHTPRTLDCGHTFCTECIQTLDRTSAPRQPPRCPECREPTRSHRRPSTAFPKNYKLLELIREKVEPTPKPGADTSVEYGDIQQLGATDPVPYSSNLEDGEVALGSEPPEVASDTDEVFVRIHWGDDHDRSIRREHPASSLANTTRGTSGSVPSTEGGLAHDLHEASLQTATNSDSSLAYLIRQVAQGYVGSGRGVMSTDGALICRFYPEGSCRYGPHCWLQHPRINPGMPLCKHWQKGQCRMGMLCNFRHGTALPFRPRNRQRGRSDRGAHHSARVADGAPGPSSLVGSSSATNATRTSANYIGPQTTVVLVSGSSATIRTGRELNSDAPQASDSIVPESSGFRASDQ